MIAVLSEAMTQRLIRTTGALRRTAKVAPGASLRCGVDLGTASIIEVVLDDDDRPVACAMERCGVARDGLVVDYMGAIGVVRRLTAQLRERLGADITRAAIATPPGTSAGNTNTHRYIVEAAGLEVEASLDEPTAANSVLGITDGAVVDIGGGTTGLAVFQNSRVTYVADEPTGGTHMNLVLMGRYGLTFDQAEAFKCDPAHADEVRAAVRPVAEKMATIVRDHVAGHSVDQVWLAGGTAAQEGIATVFAEVLGVPVHRPVHPMMVTPLGIALNVPKKGGPC